jgi:anti-sigma factor RsiW
VSACDRIRPWIARSVDGDLEPGEAFRLAEHLTTCTACRIVLARESRLASILGGVDDPCSVDESFFESVMAQLPARPAVAESRKARWRRGLRLALWASVLVAGAALAARVLPSLRLDVATPVMPRFSPDDTDRLISLIGSAAQWVRMTAQSVAWAGSSGTLSAWTIGALSLWATFAGIVMLLAVSGALAWVSRYARAARS